MDGRGGRLTTGSGALIYDLAGLGDKMQYNVQLRAVNPVGEGPLV